MATPLKEVYDLFLSKVEDYSFIRLNKTGDLEGLLIKYLRGAIVRFDNCVKDLSINENQGVLVGKVNNVEQELNIHELEILSEYMVLVYLKNRITSIKNMELIMTKSEYYNYSQANHLFALNDVQSKFTKEVSYLKNIYSMKYGSGDIFK